MSPATITARACSCSGFASSNNGSLFPAEQAGDLAAQFRRDIGTLKSIGDIGGEKSDLGAAVETAALEFEAIKRLRARQRRHGVGQLDFAAGAGGLRFPQ